MHLNCCNSLRSGAWGPRALRGKAYLAVSNDVTRAPKLWAGRKITPGHSAPCNTLHPALRFNCKFPPPKVALTGTIGMLGLRLKPSKNQVTLVTYASVLQTGIIGGKRHVLRAKLQARCTSCSLLRFGPVGGWIWQSLSSRKFAVRRGR